MKTYTTDDFPAGQSVSVLELPPELRKVLSKEELESLIFFELEAKVSSVESSSYEEGDVGSELLTNCPVSWRAPGVEKGFDHDVRSERNLRARSKARTDISIKANLKKGQGRALIQTRLPIRLNFNLSPGEVVKFISCKLNIEDPKSTLIAMYVHLGMQLIPLASVPEIRPEGGKRNGVGTVETAITKSQKDISEFVDHLKQGEYDSLLKFPEGYEKIGLILFAVGILILLVGGSGGLSIILIVLGSALLHKYSKERKASEEAERKLDLKRKQNQRLALKEQSESSSLVGSEIDPPELGKED